MMAPRIGEVRPAPEGEAGRGRTSLQVRAQSMSEADLLAAVVACARWAGWLVHHCRPARDRSGRWATPIQGDPGFPDLVLVHPAATQLIFAELKTASGRPSQSQLTWLRALVALGPMANLQVCEWRPSQWLDGTIRQALTRPSTIGGGGPDAA